MCLHQLRDSSALFRVLCGKRWELLAAMTGAGPMAIREAARRAGRDVKAVHGDVRALLHAGVLHLRSNRTIWRHGPGWLAMVNPTPRGKRQTGIAHSRPTTGCQPQIFRKPTGATMTKRFGSGVDRAHREITAQPTPTKHRPLTTSVEIPYPSQVPRLLQL